jgi:hypothetical protein
MTALPALTLIPAAERGQPAVSPDDPKSSQADLGDIPDIHRALKSRAGRVPRCLLRVEMLGWAGSHISAAR